MGARGAPRTATTTAATAPATAAPPAGTPPAAARAALPTAQSRLRTQSSAGLTDDHTDDLQSPGGDRAAQQPAERVLGTVAGASLLAAPVKGAGGALL